LKKFNDVFKGSYGWDFLSKYTVFLGILFTISRSTISVVLGLLLIGWSVWRSFSKNKSKRYKELLAFENFLIKIKQKFNSLIYKLSQYKDIKILTCPSCAQKLRVPRRKGSITVTCKKCGKKFEGKS